MARFLNVLSQAGGLSGQSLPGSTLGFFVAGPTSTFKNTFQDEDLTIANTNPVVADGEGRFPDIFLQPEKYFVEFRGAGGDLIKSADDVTGPIIGGTSLENIAAMTALIKSTLLDGVSFPVDGYYIGGDGGGNRFRWNAASTDTANGGSVIISDEGGVGRWESTSARPLTWDQFGARGDSGDDSTVFIQAAIDDAGAFGFSNGSPKIYKVSGDPAIQVDQAYIGITVDFKGARLDYGTGTGVMIEMGAGSTTGASRLWEGKFIDFKGFRTITVPYETGLLGTGIRINNMGEAMFRNIHLKGFAKGLSLNPQATGKAVTGNTFINTTIEEYIVAYHLEAAAVDACFVTNNNFFGGFTTVSVNAFTDMVTANARNVEILFPGSANTGNSMDGNTWNGTLLEQPVSRKVFCQGPGNKWDACYWDAGVLSTGNTHASGIFPYNQTGIAGFTSNGTNVITKVGHGFASKVIGGDWIGVISAVDISDNQTYLVAAIDDDTITLSRALAGTGALTSITHKTTDIEFGMNANNCIIKDGQSIGLQTITDQTAQGGIIYDSTMGIVKGPKPGLGARGADTNPGGAIDAGQHNLLNMVGSNVAGAGDFNSYLGNIADNATDGSFQLCFVALDGNGRQSVMSAIRANKEGRTTSQAFGGITFRVRPSGSNSYLVDALTLRSNGTVAMGVTTLATNATDGFLYIPSMAGVPTGTPTTEGAGKAFVFDTVNNKLMVFDGAWLGVTTT